MNNDLCIVKEVLDNEEDYSVIIQTNYISSNIEYVYLNKGSSCFYLTETKDFSILKMLLSLKRSLKNIKHREKTQDLVLNEDVQIREEMLRFFIKYDRDYIIDKILSI